MSADWSFLDEVVEGDGAPQGARGSYPAINVVGSGPEGPQSGPERLYLRESKWAAMDWQRAESVLPRCRQCRVVPRSPHVGAMWSKTTGSGVSGVVTCAARHCPGCGPKIAVSNLRTVEGVTARAAELGYGLGFTTATIQHHRGQSADYVLGRLLEVWRAVTQGTPWRNLRKREGVAGYVRSVEVKYSPESGWHWHMHVLAVFAPSAGVPGGTLPDGTQSRPEGAEPGAIAGRVARFGAEFRDRWISTARRHGAFATADGQDTRSVREGDAERLAGYMTKQDGSGIAEEMTLGAWKSSGRSLTPEQLRAEAMRGDESAAALFAEFELAQAGKHFFAISRGLLDLLGVEPEQSDEEAAADSSGVEDRLLWFTGKGWYRMARRPGFRGDLFARLAVEEDSHVVAWVQEQGGFCWPAEQEEGSSP